MRKLTKNFGFTIPINRTTTLNGRVTVVHIGDLQVTGVAECNPNSHIGDDDRYEVDLESVEWNGTNILDLLDNNSFGWDVQEIQTAALSHASGLFTDVVFPEESSREDFGQDSFFEMAANITRTHAKAIYGIDFGKGGVK